MQVKATCLTLLLVAVAVMAAKASDMPAGPPAKSGLGVTVTLFVCADCTATGQLSSRCLFQVLNPPAGAVRRHIAAAKLGPCCAANMGFREIHVEARPGDVMAGGGGAAGPAPDIQHHQPPGDASLQQCTVITYTATKHYKTLMH